MTSTVKWYTTLEWTTFMFNTLVLGKPLEFPEVEWLKMREALESNLRKMSIDKRCLFNAPIYRFMWFVYLNLAEEQKAEIDSICPTTIEQVAAAVACFPAELEIMHQSMQRRQYFQTDNYVKFVYGLPHTAIVDLPQDVKDDLIKGLFAKAAEEEKSNG